jgi:hypothetical protein
VNDIKLILDWQRCEQLADEIGMTSILLNGKKGDGNFHGFWSADNISSLLGFLCGVIEAKRVLEKGENATRKR